MMNTNLMLQKQSWDIQITHPDARLPASGSASLIIISFSMPLNFRNQIATILRFNRYKY